MVNEREANRLGRIGLQIAKSIAKQMAHRLGTNVDDLTSYLSYQLAMLIRRYRPSTNVPFDAYCRMSLKLVCYNYARDEMRPISLGRFEHDLTNRANQLAKESPWLTSDEQIADELGINAGTLAKAKQLAKATLSYSDASALPIADSREFSLDASLLCQLADLPDADFELLRRAYEEDDSDAIGSARFAELISQLALPIAGNSAG